MSKLVLGEQPNIVLGNIQMANSEGYSGVLGQLLYLRTKAEKICSKDLEIDEILILGNCVKLISYYADPDEVTTLEASLLALQARENINKYVVSLALAG